MWSLALQMMQAIPILLFFACAFATAVGMLLAGTLLGPKRSGAVKHMPYESGMDPAHSAWRRFDVRFHLVAITFLLFDVEVLFLSPWAVARKDKEHGLLAVVDQGQSSLIFVEVMVFVALLAVGFIYAWRKGVFHWR